MTFGATPDSPVKQSMVHCRGRAPDSCFAKSTGQDDAGFHSGGEGNACDFDASRCPCEFDMPNLPLLDTEYQLIAARLAVLAPEASKDGSSAAHATLNGTESEAAGPDPNNARVLMVGLGGGMLPQYLMEQNRGLSIDAVEVDPDVYQAARSFFGVDAAEASGRLRVTVEDGVAALENTTGGYRAVVVDCFVSGRVAEPCRTPRFARALFHAVRPGGEVLQNVLAKNPKDRQLDVEIKSDLEGLMQAYNGAFGDGAVSIEGEGANAVIVAKRSKQSV